MPDNVIKVNRAPVMTLWAAVVAERRGYSREEALSLGKGVAGLNAQAKGKRLGIYHEKEAPRQAKARERQLEMPAQVELLGRPVPVRETKDGLRAVVKGEPVSPASTERYLKRAFGDDLDTVREAMVALAARFEPDELEEASYALYERFRPEVPAGVRGWGQKGDLDLDLIRGLR